MLRPGAAALPLGAATRLTGVRTRHRHTDATRTRTRHGNEDATQIRDRRSRTGAIPARPAPIRKPAPVPSLFPGRLRPGKLHFLEAFAAFAAAFISCLCALTFARDSGPVMSATERNDFASP